MKFLYKIHSQYDGFTPRRIPDRLIEDNRLRLGWKRYIDQVNVGDEVWVYFHGPHAFVNGVYVKGFVQEVDYANLDVYLRVRNYSVESPLTDPETSRRIAEVVSPRYLQVFLYPREWDVAPRCTVNTVADSCAQRLCETCPTWKGLPLVEDYYLPARLPDDLTDFTPAYWVIPRRCYLGGNVRLPFRQTSDLFYRFKMGEQALAFPLASAIYETLRRRRNLVFDCVVPIPLSPDKASANEIHRTRLLAGELARLLGVRVAEVLSLNRPISKRRLLAARYTKLDFERAYLSALEVSEKVRAFGRVLLLDDVCTEGTTIGCAYRRIREVHPSCEISAVTAGQMIVKAVVKDEQALRLY